MPNTKRIINDHRSLWLTKSSASAFTQEVPLSGRIHVQQADTAKQTAAQLRTTNQGAKFFHIDLSQVVSRYIGETEKNLNAVFNRASGKNSVLFFDEADALFGKRTNVGDAHDKYALTTSAGLAKLIKAYKGTIIIGIK